MTTDTNPTPPDVETVEPINGILLYTSSLADQLYYNIFDTHMVPQNAPKEYGVNASVHHILSTDPYPQLSTDLEDSSHYGVRGSLTIRPTEDDESMYTLIMDAESGHTLDAFGSRKNFSETIREQVEENGFATVENVWGLILPLRRSELSEERSRIQFMILSSVTPDEFNNV